LSRVKERSNRGTTEYTEWPWPLSGVHSIMRVKSAQAGEGGRCTPTPFTISTITYKVLYATAERADTLFLLYPFMYSVRGTVKVKILLLSIT
jgi:hypothetical protein